MAQEAGFVADLFTISEIYSETALDCLQTKRNSSGGFASLPHDTVRRKTFKYALVVIDVASRYKDAEPLTSKESSEVAKSFEKIYSRKLKWPERIIIDPGKEFMGRVTSLMKRHNVIIQRSEAGNHRAQAFVERANRTLSERLFSFQYGKEMSSDDNERSENGLKGCRLF